jgi:hypothetical protein
VPDGRKIHVPDDGNACRLIDKRIEKLGARPDEMLATIRRSIEDTDPRS